MSLAGAWLGYPHFDAVGGLIVAVFIAHTGIQIGRQASGILSDRVVMSEGDIRRVVMNVPEVKGCHHIRTRGSADYTFLDLHVWFNADTPLIEAHRLSHVVKDRLMQEYPHIADAIIHIEPPPLTARSPLQVSCRCTMSEHDVAWFDHRAIMPRFIVNRPVSQFRRCRRDIDPRSARLQRSSMTLRLTLSVGVSSPDSIENSAGSTAIFLMRSNWDRSRLSASTIS